MTEVFWISLSTLFCGGIGLLIKSIYKIKCTEIKCCGCVDITRDVEGETRIDLEQQQHNNNDKIGRASCRERVSSPV